jgi:WD40 repeat protein
MIQPSPIASPSPFPAAVEPLPPLQVITNANAEKIQLLSTLPIPDYTKGTLSQCSVAFSPDGKLLAGVCNLNTLPIWDVQSGQLIRTLESTPVQEVAVAFSPDGKRIATGGFSNTIRLWDSATGQLIRTTAPLPSPIWELSFSPTGDRLASANFDRGSSPDVSGAQFWNITNCEALWDYTESNVKFRVLSVDSAPDGKTIAFGTFDSALLLNAETGQLIQSLSIPNHVGDLEFSPDGKALATASDDNKIRLWDTNTYELLSTLEGHKHYVNGVAFNPTGELIFSGSHDQMVGVWDVQSGQPMNMLAGHEAEVLRIDVNAAGTLITSVSWDGTVRLWGVTQ